MLTLSRKTTTKLSCNLNLLIQLFVGIDDKEQAAKPFLFCHMEVASWRGKAK